MCIAAWVTAQYIAKHSAPNTSTQDRVRFVLFASVWSITLCTLYMVLFLIAATRKLASVASHVALSVFFPVYAVPLLTLRQISCSLSITWIFWVAGAAAMTTALGGMLNCNTDTFFVYCGHLNAILVFSWIIWLALLCYPSTAEAEFCHRILVTLTLIGTLLCGIQAAKRGDGFFGSLVDY